MRDIKFRVWYGEMDYIDDLYFFEENGIHEIENGIGYGNHFICDVMQYTGLKDHKGNEIYEGDIVKGRNRMHEDWIINQKVYFLNGCFMFGNWNVHEYFNKHTEIEVIGNIYNNPELLESN